MKYILKKELPFANVGNEIGVDDNRRVYYRSNTGTHIPLGFALLDLSREGWIEEVKLREFYIGFEYSQIVYVSRDKVVKSDAHKYTEIIKVREVIE